MNKDALIYILASALQEARDHLEYCGYGDKWERQGTVSLRNKIETALCEAGICTEDEDEAEEARFGWFCKPCSRHFESEFALDMHKQFSKKHRKCIK